MTFPSSIESSSLCNRFSAELNSKIFSLKVIKDAPRLKAFSLRPSESPLEAAGEKREKMHRKWRSMCKRRDRADALARPFAAEPFATASDRGV